MKTILYNPKKFVHIMFLGCSILSILLLPFLPGRLPMQFSGDGSVNYTLPKWIGICVVPLIAGIYIRYYQQSEKLNVMSAIVISMLLCLQVGFLLYVAFIR